VRHDTDRLEDILEAIEAIERYSQEGRARFDADELVRIWILKHIEIIGEAVARLSPEILSKYPSAPWRDYRCHAKRVDPWLF
jgi:uncharacterized protein with HEPN domain